MRRCARFGTVMVATLALVGGVVQTSASAQTYPSKSVSFIVPFPAGGRTDLTARAVAQHLGKHLGVQVSVVNKPGAGGVLGAKEVAQAPADGHTLGFFSSGIVSAQYTVSTPADLRDYVAISVVNVDPAALAIRYESPWKSLTDVVQFAKGNPGKLQIGMIPGASAQLFAGGFARAAGIKASFVPFKGDADGAASLAGGHIDAHVAVPASYRALAEAKKVRVVAVAADARSSLNKDIPTFRELGIDLVIGSFHAVFAPKGTPAETVARIATALERTMKEPALVETMTSAGLGVLYLGQKETANYIAQQDALYRALIEELGLMATKK